jgi:cell wall assembly regulator SMI1
MTATLIERMNRWLAANRPDYYAELQPGVTEAQLDAFEARFSLKLPPSFRQIYRWRNGQNPMSLDAIQMNWAFSSLEDIADSKDNLDEMIGYDFDDRRWWRRGWVPFLHNGGGSYLCLDVAAEDGGQPGQLIEFWKADADRPVVYAGIDAWLEQLVAAMESGSLELY